MDVGNSEENGNRPVMGISMQGAEMVERSWPIGLRGTYSMGLSPTECSFVTNAITHHVAIQSICSSVVNRITHETKSPRADRGTAQKVIELRHCREGDSVNGLDTNGLHHSRLSFTLPLMRYGGVGAIGPTNAHRWIRGTVGRDVEMPKMRGARIRFHGGGKGA